MRIAFKMKINKGYEKEYEKRHIPIWQELEKTLIEHGVQTYSIFLDQESRDLFAYAEIDSLDKWNEIARDSYTGGESSIGGGFCDLRSQVISCDYYSGCWSLLTPFSIDRNSITKSIKNLSTK